MKYTLKYSLETEIQSSTFQPLPALAGSGLEYLDQLLEALSQLVSQTGWPESQQGEFLDYVTRDVYEFGLAIRKEAAEKRWSVVAALMRPLHERSEYVLAAAVDSSFHEKFLKYLDSQAIKGFTDRPRNMDSEARGTIDRWATTSHGQDGLLEISKSLNKYGSLLLHHGIGLSGVLANNMETRCGLLKMASSRVLCALANVLLAIQALGVNDTEAWHKARRLVSQA